MNTVSDAMVKLLLAKMEHASAWIAFTTAQANHDLQRYDNWRCDYASQAETFHVEYENALQELIGMMPSITGADELAKRPR